MSVLISNSYVSCGLKQLYRLDDLYHDLWPHPADDFEHNLFLLYVIKRFWDQGEEKDGGIVLFSDNTINNRGFEFADFLRKHELGTVVEVVTINPNSGNEIGAWLYVYDLDAVDKFFAATTWDAPEEFKNYVEGMV